jgi:radical SAM protein with 4Fe4S-binding SPASM domain
MQRVNSFLRKVNASHYPQKMFLPPKWLVLGVNNTCNLHCKMCDVGVNYTQSNFFENLMGSKPVHMPLNLFEKIVDDASNYFPNVKLGYAFTEPLIYPYLAESLQYAQKKRLRTTLTTNGLGLKKWAVDLDAAGLYELNLSLDGPEDLHNYIRGNENSFGKAIEGIEALASLNSKIKINIYCVITEWNVGRLVEFLDVMKKFQLARVGLIHSNFTPEHIAAQHNEIFGNLYPATASNVTETKLDSIDINRLGAEIRDIKKRTWNFSVDFFPDLITDQQLERYYLHPELFVGKRCMDIFSNVMIKSNGDVIPAHGRCYNLKIGNLYDQNLREIWNSSIISEFRKTVRDHGGLLPACSRCCSAFIK